MMKKTILFAALCTMAGVAEAQIVSQKQSDTYTLDANGQIVRKYDVQPRGLFSRDRVPINSKYLAGACPEVNGKVVWEMDVDLSGKDGDAIFERAHTYLQALCNSDQVKRTSKVAAVDKEKKMLVARIQEEIIFENKTLSLDKTFFNYQLVMVCKDGSCNVSMRNMSYIYEEERGGGQFPAEDMLTDKNALNKRGDGFQKGGVRKFRTRTIDRKDQLFAQIAKALKQ